MPRLRRRVDYRGRLMNFVRYRSIVIAIGNTFPGCLLADCIVFTINTPPVRSIIFEGINVRALRRAGVLTKWMQPNVVNDILERLHSEIVRYEICCKVPSKLRMVHTNESQKNNRDGRECFVCL